MSKPRTELHNVLMQYFIISVTALLVTTKSPKGCEDGYFTGYLVSLSMFSVSVFFSLICYAIVKGSKLKTEYYYTFLNYTMAIILVLVLSNFLGNLFAGNDCGFYSVRGFAACLISLCSLAAIIIFFLLYAMIEIFNRLFGFKSMKELEEDRDKNKNKEATFDKANKIG
jgi:magnesium-transporting ATPase (P-type)